LDDIRLTIYASRLPAPVDSTELGKIG